MTQEITQDKQDDPRELIASYVDSLAELLANPNTPDDVQRSVADTVADLLDDTTGDLYSRLTGDREHIITTLAHRQATGWGDGSRQPAEPSAADSIFVDDDERRTEISGILDGSPYERAEG